MVFCCYQGAVRFSVRTVLDCEQSLSLATVRRNIHECKKQDRTNYMYRVGEARPRAASREKNVA